MLKYNDSTNKIFMMPLYNLQNNNKLLSLKLAKVYRKYPNEKMKS